MGFSADLDTSDSMDSVIGIGLYNPQACGGGLPITTGTGYFHHVWHTQPSPNYASLQGQIWLR